MYENVETTLEENQPGFSTYDTAEEQIQDEPVQREAEAADEPTGYGDEEQLYDNMDIATPAPAQVKTNKFSNQIVT